MQSCPLPPYDLFAMQPKFPVLALPPPAPSWAAKESGPVVLVLSMNSVKQLSSFIALFLFPGFRHKPLREIEGSGNNLKPYNLLYLKVPLSSETNLLSLDSVHEPL